MSNKPRRGSEAMFVQDRHGQSGNVILTTTVPPELKDLLVDYCEQQGVTLKGAINEALWEMLT